jgi:DeoR/GlpR family transcriptional regulator of sugar metabolism
MTVPDRAADSRLLGEARRVAIAPHLEDAGSVTIAQLEERFGVSSVTARRDLSELERRGLVRRTHGGAVLPATRRPDQSALAGHERSFARRLEVAPAAKRRLAEEAVAVLGAHETLFLDASTTSYYVAERLLEVGTAATILTNNVPLMDLVLKRGAGRTWSSSASAALSAGSADRWSVPWRPRTWRAISRTGASSA